MGPTPFSHGRICFSFVELLPSHSCEEQGATEAILAILIAELRLFIFLPVPIISMSLQKHFLPTAVLHVTPPLPSCPHGQERYFCGSMHTYPFLILLLVFILSSKRSYLVLFIILTKIFPHLCCPPHFISLCLPFWSLSPPFIASLPVVTLAYC